MMRIAKLKNIVEYSKENVKYYRDLLSNTEYNSDIIGLADDIELFPILTKEILQSEYEKLVSDEYKMFPKMERIIIKRTSGNSGIFIKKYSDKVDDNLKAVQKIRKELNGIDPDDRFCSFYSTLYVGNKIRNMADKYDIREKNEYSFSVIGLSEERIIEIYKKMVKFCPKWISIKPSIALLFSEVITSKNLPEIRSLKFIELSGELLTSETREKIERAFRVKTYNVYSSTEAGVMAYELKDGKMHIISDSIFLEVIKDGRSVYNEEGDIYISILNDRSMPLIRYETGDRGIITHGNDDNDYIIELALGKKCEFITLNNGRKINCYVLSVMMEYANENMANVIKQYNIEQNDIDKFTVNLVIRPEYKGWKAAVEESIISNNKEPMLNNSEWNFVWKDNVTAGSSFFKNKVEDNKK